jgi:16S rRNA (guanine527-N7)-methyltransferase
MQSLAATQMSDIAIDLSADRQNALAMFNVSRETIARLDRFVDLLLAWQRRTNLISPSTIPSLWTRHVADSLQLLQLAEAPRSYPSQHAGEDKSIYPPPRAGDGRVGGVWLDLGSGGGFPGIVIACALAEAPGARIHLVESNMKKASFLREAVRETKVPGIVHAARIETLVPVLGGAADYVTARALAPLPDLLEMIAPFLKKGAKAFLPKGQDLDIELTKATKRWNIEAETVPSKTSKAGRILIVHALSRRTPTLPRKRGRVGAPHHEEG